MRQVKNCIFLLLYITLIAVCASLPKIVSSVQDKVTVNSGGYGSMQSVALDLSGEQDLLSAAAKLVLLRDTSPIPITENEAVMTEEDAYAAVEAWMDVYASADIIQWFDATVRSAQPFLCIDPDNPKTYNIFWTVSIINENEPYQSLVVDIDDETGKIFSLRYDVYGSFSMDDIWERNRAVMNIFAEIYLEQLGLPQIPVPPENTAPIQNTVEYLELDGGVLCGRYTFTDAECGEITIEFYVTGTGSLNTYFP